MAEVPESQVPSEGPPAPTVQLSTDENPSHLSTLGEESAPTSSHALPAVRDFGEFELLQEIGRGSMGVVYRARERGSGRIVALKMMRDQSGRHGNLRRFALEARATGQLSHPGIITIHARGEHDGCPFYTMDFVPGTLLSRLLDEGPLPCERAVRYLVGIAQAVGAAHALGIVHRDLKPGNVIIDAADQPRVLDFGLAKQLTAVTGAILAPSLDSIAGVCPEARTVDPNDSRGAPATMEGMVLGTPAYMAPEQAVGDHARVGPATDVHALGAIFYEMLTGRPPFRASELSDLLRKVAEREPAPLRSFGSRVPAALEEVCLRAMRKDPAERFADATTLADHLQRRWHQCQMGPRYARMTLFAALALLLLAGIRLACGAWGLAPLELGLGLTTPEEPMALPLRLLDAVLFLGGGMVSVFCGASWLGAWVWHADRPATIVATSVGTAALGWGLWLLAPASASAIALLLAGALSVAAAVAFGALYLLRYADTSGTQSRRERTDGQGFLSRLSAASAQTRRGMEARADQVARRVAPAQVGLGDFELGRTLHRWPQARVQRGRQKSLDRPVLVWQETEAVPLGEGQAGVLVRHPGLLGLYAVGAGPEGRFLVTEPANAVPLADLLARTPLRPHQAALLAARIARVLHAYHDQGFCHGRLSVDWILVRGELEPLLCPRGTASTTPENRGADLHALGVLVLDLLPGRPGRSEPLRQIAEAQRRGYYASALEMAEDLERAARALKSQWRTRVCVVLLAVFTFLPWLGLRFLDEDADWLLPALAPSCVLLGYIQARTVVTRHRLRRPVLRWSDLVWGVGIAALCTIPASLVVAQGWPLATQELLLSWLAGACLAVLATIAESAFAIHGPAESHALPCDPTPGSASS